MKSASVAELKARLSEYLAAAKSGEEVVVTDRGRPVARLVPLHGREAADARLDGLVRSGLVRPPSKEPVRYARVSDAAHDPEGLLLRALLSDREEGP
ncbi:MAG TPA: type II toxin-antitoxin system prevent-host-death family antitoxin [Longimicrobiales bacterium]